MKPINPSNIFSNTIVERFQNLEAMLSDIERNSRSVTARHWFLACQEDLEKARELLSRPRLIVCFMGRSKAGKSSAINRLLDFTLSPRGDNVKACTSAIIRFRQGPLGCELRFMTRPEYQSNREEYLRQLNIASIEFAAEIIEDIKNSDSDHSERFKLANILQRLLESHRVHEGYLGQLMQLENIVNNQSISDAVARYGIHGSNDSLQPLVSEIIVSLPKLGTPKYLELVDLPGNETTNVMDDKKWMNFLHTEANGIVLMHPADAGVDTKGLKESLDEIAKAFDSSANRMWLAVTKFKNNSVDLIWGKSGGPWLPNFRRQFPELLDRSFIFLENDKKNVQELKEMHALHGFPPGVTEDIEPAFSSLIHDGGLEHLKYVISDRLLGDVRGAVEVSVGKLLDKVSAAIDTFREEQKISTLLGGPEQDILQNWQMAISHCLSILKQRHGIKENTRGELEGHIFEAQRTLTFKMAQKLKVAFTKTKHHQPAKRRQSFFEGASSDLVTILTTSTTESAQSRFYATVTKAIRDDILGRIMEREIITEQDPIRLDDRLERKLGFPAFQESPAYVDTRRVIHSVGAKVLLDEEGDVEKNFDAELLYEIFCNKIYETTSRVYLILLSFIASQLEELTDEFETMIALNRGSRSRILDADPPSETPALPAQRMEETPRAINSRFVPPQSEAKSEQVPEREHEEFHGNGDGRVPSPLQGVVDASDNAPGEMDEDEEDAL